MWCFGCWVAKYNSPWYGAGKMCLVTKLGHEFSFCMPKK